jgi:hypothetical protein
MYYPSCMMWWWDDGGVWPTSFNSYVIPGLNSTFWFGLRRHYVTSYYHLVSIVAFVYLHTTPTYFKARYLCDLDPTRNPMSSLLSIPCKLSTPQKNKKKKDITWWLLKVERSFISTWFSPWAWNLGWITKMKPSATNICMCHFSIWRRQRYFISLQKRGISIMLL